MHNTHTVCINDVVCDIEFNRTRALRRCVTDNPLLCSEFNKTLTHNENTTEFYNKLHEFIRKKKLHISSEKPVARIKNDRYVVDVYFTIAW